MKERPILMSGPMVVATLEGRKTKTRRIVKPQPTRIPPFDGPTTSEYDVWPDERSCLTWDDLISRPAYYAGCGWCPCGGVGDRLWVRETWRHYIAENRTAYRADGEEDVTPLLTWRPSIHMPRWASRLSLTIADVAVERLQEISEADKRAEGFDEAYGYGPAAFADFWDQLHAKRGYPWSSNPWVWVTTFVRVESEALHG